jgi:hypothetical protein
MRPLHSHTHRLGRRIGIALVAVACMALGVTAAAASAKINKADFAKFVNCPIENGAGACVYGETYGGEFKMGSKTVPITNPQVLQGGIPSLGTETYHLIAPRLGAEALSKASEPIPGGLTGVTELIGGPASATAELAGAPSTVEVTPYALAAGLRSPNEGATATTLPLKVHLENELLGPNCYIGSETEPIVLNLTTGKTHPSSGESIEGSPGKTVDLDKERIIEYEGVSLVDNTFSVPAAHNCGTSSLTEPVITAAVNLAAGLPSASGNKAVLDANFFTTFKQWVEKYAKPPKVKKVKGASKK